MAVRTLPKGACGVEVGAMETTLLVADALMMPRGT
jgi:hypothetical protein